MSNFVAPAIHPKTGEIEQAEWLDDYYGRHRYGVRFADGRVYRTEQVRAPEGEEQK